MVSYYVVPFAGKDWALQQALEASEASRQRCAARAAAAEQPLTSGMPESSQSGQQQAGELLHQQLQLLTVDTQSSEAALLPKLLKACHAAVLLITAFATPAGAPGHGQSSLAFESAVTGELSH